VSKAWSELVSLNSLWRSLTLSSFSPLLLRYLREKDAEQERLRGDDEGEGNESEWKWKEIYMNTRKLTLKGRWFPLLLSPFPLSTASYHLPSPPLLFSFYPSFLLIDLILVFPKLFEA